LFSGNYTRNKSKNEKNADARGLLSVRNEAQSSVAGDMDLPAK
jgi:hypothetical protein